MDGADWYMLNTKATQDREAHRKKLVIAAFWQADYATPKERGILVGPFIVSRPWRGSCYQNGCPTVIRLSAMALLGNRTLPEAAVALPASQQAAPASDSKPFEVQAAPQVAAPQVVPVVADTTTTLDVVPVAQEPASATKVAEAVVQASQANGLDTAATAATAAAVSAASKAAAESTASADSLSKLAQAAAAIGLNDAQAGPGTRSAVFFWGLAWSGCKCFLCIAVDPPRSLGQRSQCLDGGSFCQSSFNAHGIS